MERMTKLFGKCSWSTLKAAKSAFRGTGGNESLSPTLALSARLQQPRQDALARAAPTAPVPCRGSPGAAGAPNTCGSGRRDPAPPELSRARVLNRFCRRDSPGPLPSPLLGSHRAAPDPTEQFNLHYQSFVNPVIKCS